MPFGWHTTVQARAGIITMCTPSLAILPVLCGIPLAGCERSSAPVAPAGSVAMQQARGERTQVFRFDETFAAYSRVRVTLDARRGPLTRPTF